MGQTQRDRATLTAYWTQNKRLTMITLFIWALVSFGAVFVAEPLSSIVVFGFPLSYYLGAQGSLVVFVVLVFVYAGRMNAIDREHNLQDEDDSEVR